MLASSANAQTTYTILDGSITHTETSVVSPLSGSFSGEPLVLEQSDRPFPETLIVHDFGLVSGDEHFGPRNEIEFEGLRPNPFLQFADAISFGAPPTGLSQLRSGGVLVDVLEDVDVVTYRFVDFRPQGAVAVVGNLPDISLPRRAHVEGIVVEVDQSFAIERGDCFPPVLPPVPPPGGGGVIIIGGGTLIQYEPFDIDPDEVVLFHPFGDPALLTRVAGPAPTLEELGITAPDGAIVQLDSAGALTITSTGPIFIDLTDRSFPDIPGLTSVTISTPDRIEIVGSLVLPPTVDLVLESGDIVVPGPFPIPIPRPFCNRLRPMFPAAEREIARFSFVATAATPVEIDVEPRSARNVVDPLRTRILPVAILGSDDFDIRDIDPRSLRLGDGEAPPLGRWHPFVWRFDVDRDEIRDLLAFFDARAAQIAFGDTQLCLLGETRDGELFEGCDRIQAPPPAPWWRRPDLGRRAGGLSRFGRR